MSEKITFWYGCNVVRHGDIVRTAIALLEAVGIEVTPAGGAGYCCGTAKDANLDAAEGMARRTVEKFNQHGHGAVVTWCPSCHRHMNGFMREYNDPQFSFAHITQILHGRREQLAARCTRRVERHALLHQHFGFREVDVNPLIADLLRLVPGLELALPEYAAPGHMCSALAPVPKALADATRATCEAARAAGADTVVTVFHSCQRLLCGLESTEPFRVVNYVSVLAEAMGIVLPDEYKAWKNAGSEEKVAELIGGERIAATGDRFFREAILPEIMRRPQK
jgi:Fe-S oxidoreductase